MSTDHSNTIAFPASAPRTPRGRNQVPQDPRLRLSTLLQTTLDLEQLLGLFFTELQDSLRISSLSYHAQDSQTAFNLGKPATHSCHYKLVMSDEALGELVLTRSKRLAERELESLETLVGCLILPLRNALNFQRVLQQAMRDPLTGIANRAAMDANLERELALYRRSNQALTLMAIDIDHFKRVNDTHGHNAGDFVLTNVVRHIRDCCRESDGLFRYGGEEFVVILSQTSLAGATVIAHRILEQVAGMTTVYQGQPIEATVSIGLAQVRPGDDARQLFQRADTALYRAKEEGRNRLVSAEHLEPVGQE